MIIEWPAGRPVPPTHVTVPVRAGIDLVIERDALEDQGELGEMVRAFVARVQSEVRS